ncbi:MAG: peptidoglycan recognition protein family protein [Aureispira sp.]
MKHLSTLWKKHPQWVLVVALALLLLVAAFVVPTAPKIINKVDLLQKHPTKRFPTRTLSQITRIAVHHSASENQTEDDYARYHVQSRSWPGIGYTFVIRDDKEGTIVQTNDLTTICYNVDSGNTPTIGICLSGNFSNRKPSPAQLKSLGKLIRHLRRLLQKDLPVEGHRTLQPHQPTSCPGDYLFVHLAQYNKNIAA